MKRILAAMAVLLLGMSFIGGAAVEQGVFDEALLINWTDAALQEAYGVGARGFVPSNPQPLTYIAACDPVIHPVTGEVSQVGWSERHRAEPVTAENVLAEAGNLSMFSLTLTDDPNLATFYALIQYKYDFFGKASGTDVPLYKGQQTLTLRNMVTGESAQVSRDIWFPYEIEVSVFQEAVVKQLYAGPTSWQPEDIDAFVDLLGLGLDGVYDYRDDEGGGVCITKYLGAEKNALVLPDMLHGRPVTGIGSGAFSRGEFTSVTLPGTLTHIDSYAFGECARLASVSFPDSLTSIGDSAFCECGLREVALPDGLTDIGSGAFARCPDLKSARLPAGLEAVPDAMFYGCALTAVDLPNTVEQIGEAAFCECAKLKSIALPAGVRVIAERAFSECAALTEVTCAGCIESVGSYAFLNCAKLASVRFAQGVRAIDTRAFCGCEALAGIDLYGLESLGDSAFLSDFSLKSATLPETLTQIGEHPFGDPRSDSKWEALPAQLVLTVAQGSYAEEWAQSHGIPFVSVAPPTEEELLAQRYPPLQTGSKGEGVRLLQQTLIDMGYLQDTADGSYGPKTAAAVAAAQEALGMEADGIASTDFQARLYGE